MISQIDRIRFLAARALRWKRASLDGVLLSIDPATIPYKVRSGIVLGVYESPERRFFKEVIRPADRVLDLGACIGLTSIIAAKIVGDENVLAYEADPAMQPLIAANFAMNGVGPTLVMKAVTADGRDVVFHLGKAPYSSSIHARGTNRDISVGSDPLTDILHEFRPTVVSMDIEGAEIELICSSRLPNVGKLIVEMHPQIVGSEAVSRCEGHLAKLGFQLMSSDHSVGLFVRK